MESVKNQAGYLEEKWDRVIDLFLRRTIYGGVTGALAGAILSRRGGARIAYFAFGAGFGAGAAFQESNKDIEALLHPSGKTSTSME